MSKTKRTELQLLENYRVTFENVKNVAELKTQLAEYGYDDKKMAEGEALYQNAQKLFSLNKVETEQEKQAYRAFNEAYTTLGNSYTKHRKAAKVALLHQPHLYSTFALQGSEPDAYLQWLDNVKTFYTEVKNNEAQKSLLERFKITKAIAETALSQITDLQNLRTAYEKERGESQDATQNKNKAFSEIANWMKEFRAVSKIALEDHPQLLEALKQVIKS